jgi:fatty-acyl-CoA synthase
MPTDVLVKGIKGIGPVFFQDYACSEASVMSALTMEDHVIDGFPEQTKRLTSCGKFVAGVDTRLLDPDGNEVEPNVMGELTVKSDAVMKEYWKMPEETAEALKNGRYYTGDIGVYDEDGFIYLLDRKKDMIISGGFNIYPAEIENVLMGHPAVLEVAVVGIPDDLWGEAVCAHVVLHEDEKVTEEELIGFAKEKLAGYKKPKVVKFVDSIPRTAVGKIMRKDIRAPYWEGRARQI